MVTFNKDVELNFLDLLNIMSYFIGVENLRLNITQENLDNQTAELDEKVNAEVNRALSEIQKHLEVQDKKLDIVLDRLEVKENERL